MATSVQFSKLVVTRVYKSDYQRAGTLTAELKQQVKTISEYEQTFNNGLNDQLFENSDYGTDTQTYENIETRVAWLNVPENTTKEDVQAQLNKFPDARLYKTLSNKPILSSNDKWALDNGKRFLDDYCNSQVVRYPANHENAGEIVLDPNGKVQYRRIAFSKSGHEDQDLRNSDLTDYTASAEIIEELGLNDISDGETTQPDNSIDPFFG